MRRRKVLTILSLSVVTGILLGVAFGPRRGVALARGMPEGQVVIFDPNGPPLPPGEGAHFEFRSFNQVPRLPGLAVRAVFRIGVPQEPLPHLPAVRRIKIILTVADLDGTVLDIRELGEVIDTVGVGNHEKTFEAKADLPPGRYSVAVEAYDPTRPSRPVASEVRPMDVR